LLLEHLQLSERKLRLLLFLVDVGLLGLVFNNHTLRLNGRYFRKVELLRFGLGLL
jgi:hypothetical protein